MKGLHSAGALTSWLSPFHLKGGWGWRHKDGTADLSDIGRSVFLGVHLSTDGSSPGATPHHGVHGRRDFLLPGVRPGAGPLLRGDLLGLLLQGDTVRHHQMTNPTRPVIKGSSHVSTFCSLSKWSLRKFMGRSGRAVHSWMMHSLSSCWMLCFWTYCSHSWRLRSSSLLVLLDAILVLRAWRRWGSNTVTNQEAVLCRSEYMCSS